MESKAMKGSLGGGWGGWGRRQEGRSAGWGRKRCVHGLALGQSGGGGREGVEAGMFAGKSVAGHMLRHRGAAGGGAGGCRVGGRVRPGGRRRGAWAGRGRCQSAGLVRKPSRGRQTVGGKLLGQPLADSRPGPRGSTRPTLDGLQLGAGGKQPLCERTAAPTAGVSWRAATNVLIGTGAAWARVWRMGSHHVPEWACHRAMLFGDSSLAAANKRGT